VFVILPLLVLAAGYLAFIRLRRRSSRATTPFIVGGALLMALLFFTLVRGGGGGQAGQRRSLPPSVVITAPLDGTTVGRPVEVTMAAERLRSGDHLHLIVDAPCVPVGHGVARDRQHLHLGGGETEAVLDLAPGNHTLCLEAGDSSHEVVGQPDRVTIAVR
jgi:hypothetical protein